MRNSIKKMVGIRVAAALASVLLFSVMMTVNILNMESSLKASHEASAVLERAQRAEAAHYKWSSNLSNALYAGTDFTGSTDPTTCVLKMHFGSTATPGRRTPRSCPCGRRWSLCTRSCTPPPPRRCP